MKSTELHKWSGIRSRSFLSLRFTMFGVCYCQLFSQKSTGCGTRPTVIATTGQEADLNLIPWLLSIWRYLVARFPVSSFSCLSCAAAIQVFWLSIHLKCRFDGYLGFDTHLSTPCPFLLFAYVHFFISIFCFKSFSLLFYCLAQHFSIDKLYIYLWPGGIPFHTALITSHYNQLPKEGSNSLNLRIS